MKKVKYDMSVGGEVVYGSIEVDDDATAADITALVLDDATSIGLLDMNWEVEE